ncbi:Tol-Pal system protein TolB [Nitratifractor sp.]
MRIVALFLTIFVSLFAVDTTIKIEKDVDQRARVAVVDASSSILSNRRNETGRIFLDDLKITGHFLPDKTVRNGSLASIPMDPSLRNFQYVIAYRYTEEGGGSALKVTVFKGSDSSVVMERSYRVAQAIRYPFLVHKAVSELNAKLGFTPVDWINRYVLFARYTGKKSSEIGIADYTFHYVKTIIRGGLNLFPVWGDPNQRSIYYTSYDGKLPTLYRLDFATGRPEKIMSSEGMLVCSDVSRDGKRLLLTRAPQGQPDIYEYDRTSGTLRQLTTFRGIDVGGKYADGEQSVVFVSNRLGYPNIFKMSRRGGDATQLVFHGRNNDSCDAFDRQVVYSSRENGAFGKAFNLYLTTTSGDFVRPLTAGGINQFPRFSPDGNTVLYIKRTREGNFVGYIGLKTNVTMLFPVGIERLQSIDW